MKTTIDIPDERLQFAKARATDPPWMKGYRSIEPVLRSATEVCIRQSRHYQCYADWLDAGLDSVEIAMSDHEVVRADGAVRLDAAASFIHLELRDGLPRRLQ